MGFILDYIYGINQSTYFDRIHTWASSLYS